MVVFGIESLTEPTSNAFCLNTINKNLIFDKNISNIIRLGISTTSQYLNNYVSLEKNYTSYLVKIDVRVDYLSDTKELNYKTFSFFENTVVCTDYNVCDEKYELITNVIDVDTLDINNNELYIYVVFICFIIL